MLIQAFIFPFRFAIKLIFFPKELNILENFEKKLKKL